MEVTLSGRATRTSLVILGCVGLLAVVAAIAYNVVPRKNEMHASWAVRYTATSQLLADSNVVVAGHFTAVLSQGAAPSTGIPFTNFTFAVDKVFHDPGSRVTSLNGLLVIHQTGALSGNVTTDLDDDPLFEVGHSAVLFLREYQPGQFAVVGGPQGRYLVSSSGLVSPFNSETVPFMGTEADLATAISAG
jgi:hypothetical protein